MICDHTNAFFWKIVLSDDVFPLPLLDKMLEEPCACLVPPKSDIDPAKAAVGVINRSAKSATIDKTPDDVDEPDGYLVALSSIYFSVSMFSFNCKQLPIICI